MDNGFIGAFLRLRGQNEPYWYRAVYPSFLCPLKGFCLCCTIFMIVAISAERHRAICSPLTHKPTFWPYVLMVLCTAGKNVERVRASCFIYFRTCNTGLKSTWHKRALSHAGLGYRGKGWIVRDTTTRRLPY